MPGEEDYEGERARLKRSLSLTSGSGSGRSHHSRHRRHAAGGGYELTPIFTFTHSDKDSWSMIVINIYNISLLLLSAAYCNMKSFFLQVIDRVNQTPKSSQTVTYHTLPSGGYSQVKMKTCRYYSRLST